MSDQYGSWQARGETEEIGQMGRHERLATAAAPAPAMDDSPSGSGEPVVIAHAVTVIMGALVTAGWVAIPNTVIDLVGTVVALALSTLGVILARAKVSPTQSIWTVIERYVAELVTDELDRRQV